MGLVLLICLGILYSRWHLKCHTIQQIIFGSISGILFGIAGFYHFSMSFPIISDIGIAPKYQPVWMVVVVVVV